MIVSPSLRARCASIALAAAAVGGAPALAQGPPSTPAGPTIRAIVINRGEIFDSLEVRQFWGFGIANALHAETRPYVIRRELLFRVGEPFDSARVHESARNLRALAIFSDVQIDTVATDSGLTVVVRTFAAGTTTIGVGVRSRGAERVGCVLVRECSLLGSRRIATFG